MPQKSRRFPSSRLLALVVSTCAIGLLNLAGIFSAVADEPKFDAQALEFFEKQIRPILVSRCHECHSGKSSSLKGGLRLDSRAAILKGGDTGPAAVPGKPLESLLVDAVNYGELYQMPPKSKLPASEVAALRRWVEMGLPWPGESTASAAALPAFDLAARRAAHWAWRPVRRVEPPAVRNAAWPQQPPDNFVLEKLQQRGIDPAGPADKRTLIRRAYFDVIGLPPAPTEVEAFLLDDSADAFASVVDGLLSSPSYGERWARHWMDLVRYAETHGHEFDYPIHHAAAYRDYLIRAFNEDVPYDQLVLEHIAGDLLATPRRNSIDGFNESIIGTGFWFLGEATHAPVDVLGDEAGRLDNQIDVMSKTFLGLTVACARCHDHKFDAISTADYYALTGFLRSSHRQLAFLDPGKRIEQVSQRLRESKDAGDQILLRGVPRPPADYAQRVAAYLVAACDLLQAPEKGKSEALARASTAGLNSEQLERWVSTLGKDETKDQSHPFFAWRSLCDLGRETTVEQRAARWSMLRDQVEAATARASAYPLFCDFEQDSRLNWNADGDAFAGPATRAGEWDACRAECRALEPGMVHSGRLSARLQGVLRSPTFTISHKHIFYRVAGRGRIRLIVDGYFMDEFNALLFRGLSLDVDTKGQTIWQRQGGDLERYIGHRAHIELIDDGNDWLAVDEIRFSDEDQPPPTFNPLAADLVAQLDTPAMAELSSAYASRVAESLENWHAKKAGAVEVALLNWLIENRLVDLDASVRSSLNELKTEIDKQGSELPTPLRVLAIADGSAENAHVYIRGNPRTPGVEVPRRMLEAIAGPQPPPSESGSGRLMLARQIIDPANPLTARVIVNRIWQHLFGRGIVDSADNFGVLGQPPTHPELLDYLSSEFVREGWSIKKLIRSILLSRTYQMTSTAEEQAASQDPQNLLLHRMPIRRLEGEAIRDAILAVSGRLDRTQFGPSVPVHITPFMEGRGRPRNSGSLDGSGRRSVYIEVRRNFLPPMMLAFDTPIPFSTMGRRNVSNVPAQALILMNDPFVVEQSAVWSQRALAEDSPSPRQRIRALYEQAFSRPPTESETDAALEFLEQQRTQYAELSEDGQPRIWSDLCHVLLNVKEFIYVH